MRITRLAHARFYTRGHNLRGDRAPPVSFLAPRIGIPGDWIAFIAQALWICLWVAVAIFAIIFIFGLIGCLIGWGGGMPSLMPHR